MAKWAAAVRGVVRVGQAVKVGKAAEAAGLVGPAGRLEGTAETAEATVARGSIQHEAS